MCKNTKNKQANNFFPYDKKWNSSDNFEKNTIGQDFHH